jgi:hypothetical protein
MIAGHFGSAALVKSKEPSTPLWILMFASVWLGSVLAVLGKEKRARHRSGGSVALGSRLCCSSPRSPHLSGQRDELSEAGLGLWQYPAVSAGLELILVVTGAWFYWRAARSGSVAAGRTTALANTSAIFLATFGVLVLAMDFNS